MRSSLDLHGWPELPDRVDPDLTIVQEPLPTPVVEGPPYSSRSVLEGGELQLAVRGVGRYRTAERSIIRVDPEPGAKPEDIQLYLTGAVLSVILHQRNLFPLHASCVAIAGQGIALAGPSGAGKSTLVSALVRDGATFVTDDICVLAPQGGGRFGVWPSAARTKLDPAALASLEHSERDLMPAGGDRGKFHLPIGSAQVGLAPVPLDRVYVLRDGEGSPKLTRLEGMEAVSALVEETYFLRYAAGLGLASQCFRQAGELANRVEVLRLERPRGFEHVRELVTLIDGEARGARPGSTGERA